MKCYRPNLQYLSVVTVKQVGQFQELHCFAGKLIEQELGMQTGSYEAYLIRFKRGVGGCVSGFGSSKLFGSSINPAHRKLYAFVKKLM